ncbi:hypothetical protein, partial [Klebsiella pneumoniae]
SLDEQQIAGAEIDNVVKNVVPTRNAIVRVQYDTYIGAKAIVTLKTRTGVAPFGAIVTLEKQPQRRQDIRSNI